MNKPFHDARPRLLRLLASRSARTRWLTRLALACTLLVLVLGGACGGIVGGGPDYAAIAEACGFASDDFSLVTPEVECVAYDDDGGRHAIFSYDSDASGRVVVPIGTRNVMYPAPQGRGQPASFSPGKRVGAFAVDMPEESLTWVIGWQSATANASTRRCATAGHFADISPTGTGLQLVDLHTTDVADLAAAIVPTDSTVGAGQSPITPGRLVGGFGTGPDGSASYSFALWSPPGRGGIEPNLAISYSSEGGDGPLGIGFHLRGLSQIARCSKTIIEDGTTEAVQFSEGDHGIGGDKLCLDGMPLVPADNDGTHITSYRTLHESFARITVEGWDELGPTSFKMETKGGQILHYGTRNGSRLENLRVSLSTKDVVHEPTTPPCIPQQPCLHAPPVTVGETSATYDRAARLGWSLTEVADRADNRMVIDYELRSVGELTCPTLDPACGANGVEQLPTRISYTWHGRDEVGRRLVHFVYQARPDVSDRWISGFKLVRAHRLTFVQMEAPSPDVTRLVRLYTLAYRLSPETGHSRLASLEECDGEGICKQPTAFGYNTPDYGRHIYAADGGPKLDYPGTRPLKPGATRPDYPRVYSTDEQYDPNGQILVLDINGDGLDDILFRTRAETTRVIPSTPPTVLHIPTYYYRLSNGESFGDAQPAGVAPVDVLSTPTACEAFYDAGPADSKVGRVYQKCVRSMPRPIDVDMDGIPELHDGLRLYKWNGAQYVATLDKSADAAGETDTSLYVADLDGDSFPELVPLGDDGGALFHFFTAPDGSGKYSSAAIVGPGAVSRARTFVADWYGGGNHGLLTSTGASRYAHVDVGRNDSGLFFRSGGALSELIVSSPKPEGLSYVFADLGGDGLDDAIELPNGIYAGWAWRGTRINTGVGFLAPYETHFRGDFSIYSFPYGLDPKTSLGGDTHLRIIDNRNDGRPEPWLLASVDPAELGTKLPAGSKSFAPTPYSPLAILDMNGDGAADILTQPDPEKGFVVHLSNANPSASHRPDLLTDVNDAGSFHIDYTVLHGRAAGSVCTSHKAQCLVRGRTVVLSAARYLGAATISRTDYQWGDGIYGLQGRGFLGFARRKTTDALTGTTTETTFDNGSSVALDGGYSGLVLQELQTTPLGGGRSIVRTVRYGYELTAGTLGVGARLPTFLRQARMTDDAVELTSTTSKTLRAFLTTTTYDAWGNVGTADLYGGGAHRRVVTAWRNDATTWVLGLPTRVDVSAVAPGDFYVRTRTMTTDYDADGRVTERVYAPDGGTDVRLTTRFRYEPHGLLSEVTQRDGRGEVRVAASVSYDSFEQMFPEAVADALGHVTRTIRHPATGAPIAHIDQNGIATARKYDGYGRLRYVALADGAFVDTHYKAEGALTAVTSTNRFGHASVVRIDDVGRLIEKRLSGALARDALVQVSYDDRVHPLSPSWVSRRHFVGDPVFGDSLAYDALGRLVSTTHADGTVARTVYQGLTIQTFDEVGDESDVVSDLWGRPVESVQVKGYTVTGGKPRPQRIVTRYEYTALDELQRVIDPDGNVVTHNYDDRGRMTTTDDPDAGQRTVTYNAFGDVVKSSDGAGLSSFFAADPLGRVIGGETPDGFRCYEYDTAPHGIGRLANGLADGVRTEFAYDKLGRVTESAWTIAGERFAIGTGYNADGQVAGLTYPGVAGHVLEAAFTYAGGLIEATSFRVDGAASPIWQALKRDASSAPIEELLGNGLTTARTFIPQRGFLGSIETGVGSAGAMHDKVQSLGFGYAEDGSVIRRTDAVAGYEEHFSYDGMNELRTWSSRPTDPKKTPGAKAVAVDFAYDDIGNLVTRTPVGPGAAATFEIGAGSAGPHAVTGVSTVVGSFTYDRNGNQRSTPSRSVTYTAFDLPRDVSAGGLNVHFTYDASNQRIRKADDRGTTTTTVGPYERRVDGSGTTHVFHVPGGAEVLWHEHDGVIERSTRWIHVDNLGSVQAITDESRKVVERRRYEPFGRRVSVDDPSVAPTVPGDPAISLGFTGQGDDSELDLVDMGGRIFDPTIARFLTPDPTVTAPLFAPSWNRYAYVWNDPTNLVDPSGFAPGCDELSDCGGGGVRSPLDTLGDWLGLGGGGGSSGAGGNYCSGICSFASPGGSTAKSATPLVLPTVGAAFNWARGNVGGDNTTGTSNGNNNAVGATPKYAVTPSLSVNPFPGLPIMVGAVLPLVPAPFGIDIMHSPGTFFEQQRYIQRLNASTMYVLNETAKGTWYAVNILGAVVGGAGLIKAGVTIGAGLIAGEALFGEALFASGEVASLGEGVAAGGAETLGSAEAGAAVDVNLGSYGSIGRSNNCVNCVVATDATLSGSPASALPSASAQPISTLETIYGRSFGSPTSIPAIEAEMATGGAGARGIVFGSTGPYSAGHVFNAVVSGRGSVVFIDGQIGGAAGTNGYQFFRLLKTNF